LKLSTTRFASYTPLLLKWGKLLGATGGVQILIQGLGFVSGILIIRIFSTEQYAYYTLANTMLGTMTVLANGGISAGVMAEGGERWQNRNELGEVLATGMKLRQQFAVGSLLVSLPILYFLLSKQGMPWWEACLLILCLAPAFWATLSGSLLRIVPRLHQDIKDLLRIDVGVNFIRLLILLPVLFFSPLASLAILAAGLSQVRGNIQLRKLSLKNADWKRPVNPAYRKKILEKVKRILPSSIYYCISGQITIWLVSIFNTTEGISQVGALGRLMMVLTLLGMVIDTLIVPRYARLKKDSGLVVSRYFQVLASVFGIGVVISTSVFLFPDIFLFILGDKYANLQYEVLLMTISRCIFMVSRVSGIMSSSRGIIPNPYLFIGTIIIAQGIALAFLVDYSTVAGVITFSIFTATIILSFRIIDFLFRTKQQPS